MIARASSGTLPRMTPKAMVMEMLGASDRGDFTRFRALLADDCEWVNPVVHAEGADEIARNVGGFMAGFPGNRHEVTLALESGDQVAIEGEWVAGSVRAPFAAIVHTRGPRVASVRLYLDTAALSAKLEAATGMSAAPKAVYRRWFEEVVSGGDLALADELLTADYRLHFPGVPEPVDREGHKRLVTMFRTAFPDWVETVEDLIAEEDRVVARVTGAGTHRGDFQGIAPTDRRVTATGIGIGRFADGRIAEAWAAYDALGLVQQLS